MSLIEGFTRQETLALTGTTSNRLQYLERANLIIPERVGSAQKPTVLYTWEQILEIRAIKNLRQQASLQTVKKIIEFLDKSGFDDTLRDKQIVVIDEEAFWVRTDWADFHEQMPKALKVASKKKKDLGQYVLIVIPPLIDIVNEVWEAAKNSANIINFPSFEARAKASASKRTKTAS
ncbi:MAG: helix-turn-helix domain-containing protein [Drouetiella hepatica Uher 2000/2452]|jgi:DNA-binding transcriptional MerR regulator|uniref:Helix-turn-helix domain-containing protein n=1 Tax=Drouetiella hepatica Uher 2000/2452 TaxID=904376 RepID=A0A951UR02_9CYAN|nr:helix-turn-helix domain-containing protein [Drouetiella hepatica Uher 2000/2452]